MYDVPAKFGQYKIAVVVPTVRPELMKEFVSAWTPLFIKYGVTLVTVWDGEAQYLSVTDFGKDTPAEGPKGEPASYLRDPDDEDLFCRRTDACRNWGFLYCAYRGDFTHVLTLDDDVRPQPNAHEGRGTDPIGRHLYTLGLRVSLTWMNTCDAGRWCGLEDEFEPYYLRGFPYVNRHEAQVMLSHGVWTTVPDFDGETQLAIEQKRGMLPPALPYHVGPIPKGVYFPLCGMNVMVRAEALPYLYFAPMGKDSGFPDMHRFADIFMGILLKEAFDRKGWACYTGGSLVVHSRASDALKNYEQEKYGRAVLDEMFDKRFPATVHPYVTSLYAKSNRYAGLIRSYRPAPGGRAGNDRTEAGGADQAHGQVQGG